ncbi:hypothetical protein FOIG_16972 [Fusarium odoratissimum NRRL 54006]|uniref:Uncharacterized protein n=1 Tax=Fusarium odoratissimum (strain NRRL 54006) TaxID=1089451 RepID=X0ILG5_FUSO5|nr:uncharacterized protein FOIG_16972 [Fusarium odoratissimum NRRL 54006]EXL89743.1 hypothetical protein FOIG_16972 [Fusarium odoratissimum NRRL 54006]
MPPHDPDSTVVNAFAVPTRLASVHDLRACKRVVSEVRAS